MVTLQIISPGELEERLQREAGFQFWNVLTDPYFGEELIPGSRHVPLDRIGRETVEANIPKDAEIVVYCTNYECPQSTLAAQKLAALGYTNVVVYKGGIEEWDGTGHELIEVETNAAA